MLTLYPRRGVTARRRTVSKARKMQAEGAKDALFHPEEFYGVGAAFQAILSLGAMILTPVFLWAYRLLRLGFGPLRSVTKNRPEGVRVKILP